MDKKNNAQYTIDELASQAGGYFSMPTQEDIAYIDLLFDVCQQFGIRYYSASAKEKAFVEEVTRVTWRSSRKLQQKSSRISVLRFQYNSKYANNMNPFDILVKRILIFSPN